MLETVRDRARPYFEDAPPAHDWHHVQRVAALAETLVAEESASVDERSVQLAIALHDIGREREDRGEIEDHARWGARKGEAILEDVGASEETIDRTKHCIRAHRYSNDVEPETIEAEIVSDADNLDALGAVGIARAFAHGSVIGSPLYDPAVPPAEDETTAGRSQYNHFHKKILELPERMYTDAGRELAAERAAFVREYLERFEAETVGEA
ncbi:HD domain-containing protein [Natronococcus occultus]|uniref:Putative HD superfamily hydrolase n=1 Tax=Natronococcus occultus SP4 TaxID=694430 RepID=L0JV36_9EURY|nr:HD domain-containing protein [Natronococcus occultus]AGB35974.1 putative HD superfamily hydrolase [Natronococcus occultus SP4]